MLPKRHCRSRAKGSRQPASCKYVGRGTVYGNHWIIGKIYDSITNRDNRNGVTMTRELSIQLYAQNLPLQAVESGYASEDDFLRPLLEYEYLSCFCKLTDACHCDVIIEKLKLLEMSDGKSN
jgi:hypothetical protein